MDMQFLCKIGLPGFEAFALQKQPRLLEVEENAYPSNMLGWQDMKKWSHSFYYAPIQEIADEVRQNADYFVVVGLGGSNQGARAVIEALRHKTSHGKNPKILYAALNLSAEYLQHLLEEIGDKSVYINVIAKNFQTIEPGITFRFLRQYMESRYSPEEAARRILITGTENDGHLHPLATEKNYRFFQFPLDVGGRYSAFTVVGLLPMAVAGVDIQAFLSGARHAQNNIASGGPLLSMAKEYALRRNYLLQQGYSIEVLAHFEPCLEALSRWWRQLFGESEGKNFTGIFPSVCSYTEDLHSMGQYMQQGKRQVIETFLRFETPPVTLPIPKTTSVPDGYDFLNGKTLHQLNQSAFQGTLSAHSEGGVPCFVFTLSSISEESLGQLLYFFMTACFYSARVLGVNPFDQPGVENYKDIMNQLLERN